MARTTAGTVVGRLMVDQYETTGPQSYKDLINTYNISRYHAVNAMRHAREILAPRGMTLTQPTRESDQCHVMTSSKVEHAMSCTPRLQCIATEIDKLVTENAACSADEGVKSEMSTRVFTDLQVAVSAAFEGLGELATLVAAS